MMEKNNTLPEKAVRDQQEDGRRQNPERGEAGGRGLGRGGGKGRRDGSGQGKGRGGGGSGQCRRQK